MPINNITQTISELPEAGRRGIDVQTQFVIKQEDFQDHLQGTTVTELNTLKDQLNMRISEINSTTTTMDGYATSASSSATTATTKAAEASTSASAALTSRNQASTFATNSSNSATKASQWADNNYNVAVEAGKYSAKHWATEAQNATASKVDKVTSTDNAIVRFDGVTGSVQNSTATISDTGVISGISFNSITGLSSTLPLVAGTATIGVATTATRADHIHPAQTTITGNAGTATTLQTSRTINGVSFNGSANINIEDRLGTAIASASTTTVGTAGLGDYIHITGAVTITSLGTASASGIRRTLIFDAVLTITHNATSLICLGATNIVTVAGTIIEVIAETTANWRVVSVTHPSIGMAELGYLDGVTSDIQTQMNLKAPLASPTFTGTPTAPTAAVGTSTTQVATTAFVNAEIANDAVPRVTSTDNAIVRFDGTTGDVQNSSVIIDDNGNVGVGEPIPISKFHVQGNIRTGCSGVDAVNTRGIIFDIDGSVYGRLAVDNSGSLRYIGSGLGYGTGSGGTVTQLTSKSTAVTLNKPSGQITMNNAALAAGASVTFVLNNSLLSAQDTLCMSMEWNLTTSYRFEQAAIGVSSTLIRVTNISGSSLSEALQIKFNVIKGANS